MKFERIKYKRTTPKSQTVHSSTSFSMGDGLDRLLSVVVKLIEKYFGLLYISICRVDV